MGKRVQQTLELILLLMLSALIASAIYANWNLNPIWDVFFARITGPIFYGAHATPLLVICLIAVYLSVFKYHSFTIPTIALFGTASIHELSLLGVGYLLNGLLNGIWFAYNNISLTYAVWLVVFLIIGLRLLPNKELKTWGLIAVMMLSWWSITAFLPIVSTLDPSHFYNLGSNVEEGISWFLPTMIWLLPRNVIK